ncbi:MAG: hypothetical protein O3A65_05090 [Proteobacteria bacterium]|nr:hypothetical protein [Pseudomonadota bacterium]
MKRILFVVGALVLNADAAFAQDELCVALKDTALFSDARLKEELRPIFQFDGAQFKPETKDGEVMYGLAYDVRMEQMLEEASFVRASDWACEVVGNTETPKSGKSYDATAESCRLELSDTRLTVSATTLIFYESSCDVVDEKAGDGGARILSLQCSGSGDEWPAQLVLKDLKDGSLSLETDGQAQAYVLCDS